MGAAAGDGVRYRIFDPTGNITALVEDGVEAAYQPSVADVIMQRHPEVEQVGFVRSASPAVDARQVQAELRMAGGEFCGNATMCAAALYLLWQREGRAPAEVDGALPEGSATSVMMRVSGAAGPVEVRLWSEGGAAFGAGVHMPAARRLEEVELTWGDLRARVPLVRMEGISHLVIEPGSALAALREQPARAEEAVRAWCAELSADGLGLMFLGAGEDVRSMAPLVYVPGSNTVFWESSCASGSSAVGMYLSAGQAEPVTLVLREPGGELRVESDPSTGETWLYGHAVERAAGFLALND